MSEPYDDELDEMIKTLIIGGMTKNDDYLRDICLLYREHLIAEPLEQYLDDHPEIYEEAKRNRREFEEALEKEPFRLPENEQPPEFEGDLEIGTLKYYGNKLKLDSSKTGHIGIFGEPGSGKTTLILRLLEQLKGMNQNG